MNFSNNIVLLLAGGKGERIKKISKGNPKPLLKFNNIPLLTLILKNLCKFNFKQVYILAGYKSHKIYKKYNNKLYNFTKINVLKEKKLLGTWGAIFKHKKKISKNFFVINSDTIYENVNLSFFHRFSLKKTILVMMITKNHLYKDNKKLNGLFINKKKNIFIKKNNYINSGHYFFSKKIFNHNVDGLGSIENEVIPYLLKKKLVKGLIYNKKLIDIGTPKNLIYAKRTIPRILKKPAAFLDRDGVINYDYRYVHKYNDFHFKSGVLKALKYLNKKNYYIFFVSNQAGIGKGFFSEKDLILMHNKIKNYLLSKNIVIDDVKYCPFHPHAKLNKYRKKTNFRKPGNAMINELCKEWIIEKKKAS